ncbi:uncharacterized protein LOC132555504 [Ylistrum balloti]|uniref:uncharacterized protein LOC132555504 n=1 Tax=Ylistrum balloti TaxID=509963 RepID=UPI0029057E91|nr:uncharacterized protein LOC132555504 [Ylistrum balloti]
MDDTHIEQIAKTLVTNAVQKAIEKVRAESIEMAGAMESAVDDIVKMTIGQSISNIQLGHTSPTDHKMAEMRDENVDDIVTQTLERSILSVRKGLTSPTDQMMAEMTGQLDKNVDVTIEMTIGRSIQAIRDGQTSPTSIMMLDNDMRKLAAPETGRDVETHDAKPIKTNKEIVFCGPRTDNIKAPLVSMTTGHHHAASKEKKNTFERFLDRILGRGEKKNTKKRTPEANDSATSGEISKKSSKAHNRRDWILKHVLCCFVRQTATVEPDDI